MKAGFILTFIKDRCGVWVGRYNELGIEIISKFNNLTLNKYCSLNLSFSDTLSCSEPTPWTWPALEDDYWPAREPSA